MRSLQWQRESRNKMENSNSVEYSIRWSFISDVYDSIGRIRFSIGQLWFYIFVERLIAGLCTETKWIRRSTPILGIVSYEAVLIDSNKYAAFPCVRVYNAIHARIEMEIEIGQKSNCRLINRRIPKSDTGKVVFFPDRTYWTVFYHFTTSYSMLPMACGVDGGACLEMEFRNSKPQLSDALKVITLTLISIYRHSESKSTIQQQQHIYHFLMNIAIFFVVFMKRHLRQTKIQKKNHIFGRKRLLFIDV